jgi:NhaP-type Na+/H+ or K+/H+ antiporter/Trk K+ transport system NAD-binding subunit
VNADPSALLQTISIALLAGIVAQYVAERLAIPSIVPLLLAGILLGRDGLGWLQPRSLADGLKALVNLSMAIILFEGGLRLEWRQIKTQQRIIVQLLTVGAFVTLVGAAVAAHIVLPLDRSKSLLLGSMVIVTGPTVIGPLLKRVRIVRRVALVLESESVLIDPIGAIVAFVMLEIILNDQHSVIPSLGGLAARFAVGPLIGVASGALLAFGLRRRWTNDIHLINLGVLAGVMGTFVLANHIRSESGLIAVVAAGAVMGNLAIPAKRELVEFKGLLTTLVISLLFVLLSADIQWTVLTGVGWGGLAWVATLMLVVRPVSIFISGIGTRTPFADKLLLSWISPRGIVAGSVASLFAIYLTEQGVSQGELLQALVFLTIIVTVIVQGLTAGPLARILGLGERSFGVVIVGANTTGRLLGHLLRDLGREVALIDSNDRRCEEARRERLAVFGGNCLETDTLELSGIRSADAVVAVTLNSEVNYLVARLAVEEFRVPRGIALLTEGDKAVDEATRESHRIERAFAISVSDEINDRIRRDSSLWRARIGDGAPVPLRTLILNSAVPLAHVRAGYAQICSERTTLAAGDELIFLGKPDDARLEAVASYSFSH